MGLFDFLSRRRTIVSTPANAVPTRPAPHSQPAAGAADTIPTAPGSPNKIHGVPVHAVDKLAGTVLTDPDRVKWVLLQSETDVAARRFVSLAAMGESRADETREARAGLRKLLRADLPGIWPEHIDMLLDVMQAEARRVLPQRETIPLVSAAPAVPAPPPAPAATAAAPPPDPAPPAATPAAVSQASAAESPADPAPHPAVAPPYLANASTPPEFELCTIPGSTTHDIDMARVREYAQSSSARRPWSSLAGVDELEVLRTLRAIDGPPGGERVTVLGALFFAKNPERLVVQSKVRFVEFPGTEVASSAPGEKVAYRYTEEIFGTIPQLVARMEGIHKQRLAPGVLADDGFRVEEIPVVPLFALREAMVNAVCHRDYSLAGANIQVRLFEDRLEVQSPGSLPEPVTVDNIVDESYARNPRIADILRDLGYVERHGLGIDNMIKAMSDAGLPKPQFSSTPSSFTVILRFKVDEDAVEQPEGPAGRPVATSPAEAAKPAAAASGAPLPRELPDELIESLPASQRRILDIVIRHGRLRASEILAESGLKDRRTVQRTLAALAERGLIVRKATSKTDPNATYELDPKVWDEEA